MKKILPLLAIISAGALWGINTPISKIATSTGAHPITVTFWQCTIAFLILLVLAILNGERMRLTKQLVIAAIIAGSIGLAVPNVLFLIAVKHIPVGIISIAVAVVPLVTLCLSVILKMDAFSIKKIIGIMFGIFSVLVVINSGSKLENAHNLQWILIALVAACGYAISNITLSIFLTDNSTPLTVTSGLFFVASICMIPFMVSSDIFIVPDIPFNGAEIAIILLGIFIAVAHFLYVLCIKYAGPVFASLATYIVTIAGIFGGVLILGERPNVWVWLSLLLVIVSISLVSPKNNDTNKDTEKIQQESLSAN